ncbi:MAG TPA: hypothetical protein VFJ90_08495 [Candidatus Didemnitutus sp.]|nr:hypothetical protein [Candidatus Didemnitutus sp.]
MNRSSPSSRQLRSSPAFLMIAAIGFAVCVATAAQADTLVLTNGRTYNDARIVSASPLTVTVRHAGGFIQVDKVLLPEALRAQYPIDSAAAAAIAQQEKERHDRVEAIALQKREAAAALAARLEAEKKTGVAPAETDEVIAARTRRAAHDRALSAAGSHFRTQWTPNYGAVAISSLQLKIDNLDQAAGSDGQWRFTGSGSVNYRDQPEQAQAGAEAAKSHRALVAFQGTLNSDGSTTLTPRVVTVTDFSN